MSRGVRWMWLVLVPAACLAYQWLAHIVIVATEADRVGIALAILNAALHAAINLAMLWVFGRTLVAGREPLITGFARRVHGSLPPYLETYTRNATAAWCVFFAAQIIVSIVLFAFASLDTWSLFVNVLSFPSVAGMFVAEYVYRVTRYPDYPHSSIWTGIRAFASHRHAGKPGARSTH